MHVKTKNLILLCILLLGLFLRLYHVSYPYLDHHSWRQTDTAMIARNFYRNNFNILRPEIDWNGDEPSVIELEFQITPYLTSILYIFFGIKDWVGRIVPIIFSLLSIIYIYKLIEFYHNSRLALFSTFVYAILPLNVFFTRVLMPESGMILFSIAALYYFSRFTKYEKQMDFILSIIFTTLAFLSKLSSVYLIFPLAYIVFLKYKFKFITNKRIWLFFLITLLITALYYGYMHYNADIKIMPYKIGADKWGNLQIWNDSNYYKTLFLRFRTIIFTSIGLLLLIAGLILGRQNLFFYSWLGSVILYFFVVAKGNAVHTYYQMPIIPIGAYFIGIALYRIYKIRRLRIFSYVMCLVLLYASLVTLLPLYGMYAYSVYPAASKLQEIDPDNSLVLSVPHRKDTMPELLYYADRKGWVIRPSELSDEKIEEYIKKGVKYMVMTEPNYLKSKDNLWGQGAYITDNFIILKIA